jgi:hypothetical protein
LVTKEDAPIAYAKNLLNESKESLERTRQKVVEAKDIGVTTAAKLEEETDKIRAAIDNTDAVGSTVERSKPYITAMLRSVATDKYTWVLIVLVLAAIVFLVVWKKTHPSSAPDVYVPPVHGDGVHGAGVRVHAAAFDGNLSRALARATNRIVQQIVTVYQRSRRRP